MPKKRFKYGEITLKILEFIATSSEGVLRAFVDQKGLKRHLKYGYPLDTERFFEYLRRLEGRGYVEIKATARSYSIKLTQKGEIKLLENQKENKIDGKWRMLSFDIPEESKNQRNLFRSSIKRIGFKMVQKSLWTCPFIKADQIEKIINYYNLNKYVAYLVVEKSDIEEYLKSLFKQELKDL